MLKKFNNSIIFLIIILISSCTENENRQLELNKSYLDDLESFINDIKISKESILVWRRGSISWSTKASLVVITPIKNNKRKVKLDYYMIYGQNDNSVKSFTKYSFITYDAELYKSILNQINLFKKPIMDNENKSKGEGIYGNKYYLQINSQAKIIVNCKSNLRIRRTLFKLYHKISPSEYYQSLSLQNCDFNKIRHKASQLYFGRDKKTNFLIPYTEFIPSLYSKQLQMKILENGDTIYTE